VLSVISKELSKIIAKTFDVFARIDYNVAMDFVKIKAPLTAKGNTLAQSNSCVEINAYSQDHRFHQIVLYLKTQPKSIYKFNQRFNGISTNNFALKRYIIAFDWTNAGESFYQLFESSLVVSRAWKMISFWVEIPFWVSSLHAQPVLPVLTRIPLELKGDPSRVPLFHGRTPYICEWPATHGLGTNNSPSPWPSTHAALVSPAKEVARETRERRESTANELHELPRIKVGHGRTRTVHGR